MLFNPILKGEKLSFDGRGGKKKGDRPFTISLQGREEGGKGKKGLIFFLTSSGSYITAGGTILVRGGEGRVYLPERRGEGKKNFSSHSYLRLKDD